MLILVRSLLCYLFMLSSVAYAFDLDAELEQKLKNIKTYKAHFEQTVVVNGKLLSKSYGSLYLLRPGKFMWDTKTPVKQKIIADGSSFWIYDKDLDQVTVQAQNSLKRGTIGLFLSDTPEISKFFKVEKINSKTGIMFKLKTKKADYSQIRSLNLVFNHEILQAIVLEDELGQKTSIKFLDVEQNIKLATGIFNFVVPKGVDLIRI